MRRGAHRECLVLRPCPQSNPPPPHTRRCLTICQVEAHFRLKSFKCVRRFHERMKLMMLKHVDGNCVKLTIFPHSRRLFHFMTSFVSLSAIIWFRPSDRIILSLSWCHRGCHSDVMSPAHELVSCAAKHAGKIPPQWNPDESGNGRGRWGRWCPLESSRRPSVVLGVKEAGPHDTNLPPSQHPKVSTPPSTPQKHIGPPLSHLT